MLGTNKEKRFEVLDYTPVKEVDTHSCISIVKFSGLDFHFQSPRFYFCLAKKKNKVVLVERVNVCALTC